MGEYFCDICKFYDDDVSFKFHCFCICFVPFKLMHVALLQIGKGQYHCNDCGICR